MVTDGKIYVSEHPNRIEVKDCLRLTASGNAASNGNGSSMAVVPSQSFCTVTNIRECCNVPRRTAKAKMLTGAKLAKIIDGHKKGLDISI